MSEPTLLTFVKQTDCGETNYFMDVAVANTTSEGQITFEQRLRQMFDAVKVTDMDS